jgi:hypothetical protein
VGADEEQPRVALDDRVGKLSVLEEVEDSLDHLDRRLGAEGVERFARGDHAVADRLLGDVAFGEMVDELRVDAVETPLEPLLELLGVAAVERLALAARERAIEDVADDAAGKREAVAARLALFLEDPVDDQPLDDLVEVVLHLAERLEVAELEGLA